jgi:signal peptide peptidase SppA
MNLLDILNGPMAMRPEKLLEIREVYLRHEAGITSDDLAKFEVANNSRPMRSDMPNYQVENGVAVLPVDGILGKGMNLMMRFSGGTSTQMLSRDLALAANDPTAPNGIVMVFDTPGGTVDGTQQAAAAVRAAALMKPVVAVVDGEMASGGYWIGSAADQIFIQSDTDMVGSIGVVATHEDVSGALEKQGVKRTEITAGKYKRIASSTGPLTDEGRATIQETVDHIYSVFVNEVAANRNTTVEDVLARMADGRIFLGQKAIDAGLVNGKLDVTGAIKLLGRNGGKKFYSAIAREERNAMKTYTQDELDAAVTAAQNKAQSEAKTAEAAARAEGKAEGVTEGKAAGIAEGKALGATEERTRIQGVESQSLPGHDDLVKTMKYDGKTTPEQAAVKILNAEREKNGTTLSNLAKDAKDVKVQPSDAAAADAAEKAKAEASAKNKNVDHAEIARMAQTYKAEQEKQGNMISTAQAVAHIYKEKGIATQ